MELWVTADQGEATHCAASVYGAEYVPVKRVPLDEAVERMWVPLCCILSDAFDLDGHVTDVVHDEQWKRAALNELLRAILNRPQHQFAHDG